MTRDEQRAYVLNSYGNDCRTMDNRLAGPRYAELRRAKALAALAQIDAGKQWPEVLEEFER